MKTLGMSPIFGANNISILKSGKSGTSFKNTFDNELVNQYIESEDNSLVQINEDR